MEKRRQKEFLTTWDCLNCMQENFTTVAIVCYRYERLAVLQNTFAIILLWASEDVEKLFEETFRK